MTGMTEQQKKDLSLNKERVRILLTEVSKLKAQNAVFIKFMAEQKGASRAFWLSAVVVSSIGSFVAGAIAVFVQLKNTMG